TRGKRLITQETKNEMKTILAEIQSGQFAKEWLDEYNSGQHLMEKLRKENAEHPIEKVGANLRKMMSWLFKKNKKEDVGV
ncbi:MAG TPA: ketol-acid reductoisomerase, partial [Ignavibacteria bacterium]|nr:ketol-acid reductoisomerase [Ignavibacteria bacterium]